MTRKIKSIDWTGLAIEAALLIFAIKTVLFAAGID